MTTIRIDESRTAGAVSPNIYGQFSEHLVDIITDGLWSELIKGRKFETPIVTMGPHPIAAPWAPFAGRTQNVSFRRGPAGARRIAAATYDSHHTQSVEFASSHDGSEKGLVCPEVMVDEGTEYVFRAKLRRFGAADQMRVALRASDGTTVLASAHVKLSEVKSKFPEAAAQALAFMDPTTFQEVTCTLVATGTDHAGHLSLTFEPPAGEPGGVHLYCVSLMPADNLDGWHRETVDRLAALPVRMVKWPGGCFADGWRWEMGIGPRDDRHCYTDPAWLAWEENDVGVEEYMRFCELTGSEPLIGVNMGTGTPQEAARLVAFLNAPSHPARSRAEPYGVRRFVIGNEMYGYWERGGLPGRPAEYAARFREFSDAMRAVDSSVILIASSEMGDYTRSILAEAGDVIDEVSLHFYPPAGSPENPQRHLASAAGAHDWLQRLRDDIAAAGGAGRIRAAIDEWGWGGDHMLGALFNALVLNAFIRHGDFVSLGSRTCVVNADGLLTRRGQAVQQHLAYDTFKLYNDLHRTMSVEAEVQDVPMWTFEGRDMPVLDVAALSGDNALSVFVVNQSLDEPVTASLPGRSGVAHVLSAPELGSSQANLRTLEFEGPSFTFPPASLVAFDLR